MKNFKENAMMQEMTLQEMQDVNGGSLAGMVFTWLLGNLAWSVAEDPGSAKENFNDGMSFVLGQ